MLPIFATMYYTNNPARHTDKGDIRVLKSLVTSLLHSKYFLYSLSQCLPVNFHDLHGFFFTNYYVNELE
jgi:hypothetical protein